MVWNHSGRLRRVAAALLLPIVALTATPARAQATLEVAYIPIMPMAQLFVMEGEGWAKEAGLDLKLIKFDSKPCFVVDEVAMREMQLEGYKS